MLHRLPIEQADRDRLGKHIAQLKERDGIRLRVGRTVNGFVFAHVQQPKEGALSAEKLQARVDKFTKACTANGLVPLIIEVPPQNTVLNANFTFRPVQWTKDGEQCNGFVSVHRPHCLIKTLPNGTHELVAVAEPLSNSIQSTLVLSFRKWQQGEVERAKIQQRVDAMLAQRSK